MGVYDKQGNPHHSASRARLSDEMHSGKKPAAVAPMKEKSAGAADGKGGEHDVSHMHIKDVVKQHGPAHEIHSTHDHEAGEHHVHSIHGEKHHHSDHDTHEDAHHHMGLALGVNAANKEPQDHEEFETPETEANEEARAGGSIPGM
jgi:hypothetical protein